MRIGERINQVWYSRKEMQLNLISIDYFEWIIDWDKDILKYLTNYIYEIVTLQVFINNKRIEDKYYVNQSDSHHNIKCNHPFTKN